MPLLTLFLADAADYAMSDEIRCFRPRSVQRLCRHATRAAEQITAARCRTAMPESASRRRRRAAAPRYAPMKRRARQHGARRRKVNARCCAQREMRSEDVMLITPQQLRACAAAFFSARRRRAMLRFDCYAIIFRRFRRRAYGAARQRIDKTRSMMFDAASVRERRHCFITFHCH